MSPQKFCTPARLVFRSFFANSLFFLRLFCAFRETAKLSLRKLPLILLAIRQVSSFSSLLLLFFKLK
jgi:hypothetical protein